MIEQARTQERDWPKIQAHIKDYVDGYEMIGEDDQGRDGCHTPTAGERALIEDAIHGLLGEPDFDALYRLQPAEPVKVPSVPDHLIERLRKHCEDKANTAFSRSTMREALHYLTAPPADGQAQQDVRAIRHAALEEAARFVSGRRAGRKDCSDVWLEIGKIEHGIRRLKFQPAQPDPAIAGDGHAKITRQVEDILIRVWTRKTRIDESTAEMVALFHALLKRVQPTSGAHPPSRHCMCVECAPSFEPASGEDA